MNQTIRSEEKIVETLVQLSELWLSHPELRLGQLLTACDVRQLDDQKLIDSLKAYYNAQT